ncbi:complement component C8 alpha chain [Oncorhynchus keta]|uniref:complement component C8 alpha chain n=1 Tax=Oncorhynchus keta TaxID=8018 RepID=UPI00227CCC62|nr:complement component C8 alpha chain [Oncorhynchus keta]
MSSFSSRSSFISNMNRLICVLLGSYLLLLVLNKSLTVDATEYSWNMAETRTGQSPIRRVRSVNKPAPINCKMKMWSSWTPCDSCTDKKFRFRYMEKASQFGGRLCLDSQWEELACPTAQAVCWEPDICGERFTCNATGRCVSQALRCNGEVDCDDESDETDCEQVDDRQDKCSTLLPVPGAGRGTQGFNILTGEFVDHVLDPQYYGGQCEYVYNGEWRKLIYDPFCENLHYNEDEKNYRKPYNFHTYRFMAQATSEGSSEYYEDMARLLKARKTEDSFNLGVTVGIQYVEFGVSGNVESEFLTYLTKYTNQELGFIRLQSKVQTAQFKMRSEGLMLHEDMYLSLMELPEEKYDFGLYSRFLNTYGTHYVTQGIMGGTLEYVAVVNTTAMTTSKIDAEQLKGCLGGSIGISSPIGKTKQVEVGGKLEFKGCKGTGSYEKEMYGSSSLIKDIVTLVKGGSTGSSGGLLAIKDPDTYRKWGLSLKYNPTLIEFETLPIFELVRLSTAGDHVGARPAHLRRAWEEYLLQFNSCRCAPCRHDGIPVLSQTSCHCICKQGFGGEACEETLRKGSTTDGAWSCWGTWSSCQSGSKTRRRSCDNPQPDGGAACLGSSSQNQRC